MFKKQYSRQLAGAVLCAVMGLAHHQVAQAASGFERGPDPTIESLSAKGSFDVGFYEISRTAAKGYGGATVYFPYAQGQTFGIVSLTPGFLANQSYYKPLAQFIASHGFVVVNIDPNSIYDQPYQRATEMAAALKQVVSMAKDGKVPFAAVTDVTRRAVAGHSMGGGGTLAAATADPTLKAAVPLAPWSVVKSFSNNKVPTLIVSCQNDTVAPPKQHADVFYASLSKNLPRAKVEVKSVSHMCATNVAPDYVDEVGKATVSWLKRFLDSDKRYDRFVKGEMNVGDFSDFDVGGF